MLTDTCASSPFFENNLPSPQGTDALKDGEKQAGVWKRGLRRTKLNPRNKPRGQPAATLAGFEGKHTENNPVCPSSNHQKIKLADWVWANSFLQAAMVTFSLFLAVSQANLLADPTSD